MDKCEPDTGEQPGSKSEAEFGVLAAARAIQKALEPSSELSRRVQEQMKPIMEATAVVAQRIQPYLDAFQQFAQQMQPALDALQELEKQYRPHLLAIAEGMKRFEEFNAGLVERHRNETLALPPCFGELTLPEIYELFEDHEKPALEVYRDYFSKKENIEALLGSWQQDRFYEDRIPILRDALDAHLDGKYTLSIPAFLAQIEGILCEMFNVKDHAKVKGKLSRVQFNTKEEDRLFASAELVARIITDQVFHSSAPEDRQADYPNRHRILHGLDPFYYRDKNASLRCILLLDLVRSKKFLALNSINQDTEQSLDS